MRRGRPSRRSSRRARPSQTFADLRRPSQTFADLRRPSRQSSHRASFSFLSDCIWLHLVLSQSQCARPEGARGSDEFGRRMTRMRHHSQAVPTSVSDRSQRASHAALMSAELETTAMAQCGTCAGRRCGCSPVAEPECCSDPSRSDATRAMSHVGDDADHHAPPADRL